MRFPLFVSRIALTVMAVVAMLVPLGIGLIRLRYPYELEWLESGLLEHSRRVAEGLPLYTPPTVDFVEYPYPPMFMYITGALGAAVGTHFWTVRLVSIIATLATYRLIARIVRRETERRWAGIFAAGVYAASYGYVGGFFDVGKADSLFLAFTLWGLDRVRTAETKKHALLAGVMFAGAILTKQTALFVAVPVAAYLLVTRWSQGLTFSATITVVVGGFTGFMSAITHGWFFYFVWQLLLQHGEVPGERHNFFKIDLLPFWPTLIAALLATTYWVTKDRRWASGLLGAALLGLGVGSLASRLHEGGFVNVLMPVIAGIAMVIGITAGWLVRKEHWRRGVIVVGLCALQFAFLRYDAGAQVPSVADRQAGDNFIAAVKTFPGPVLIAAHPTYEVLAGKPVLASQGGVIDIMRGTNARAKQSLLRTYGDAIYAKRFSALMLDSDFDTETFPADWQSYYCAAPGTMFPPDSVFRPITSHTSHPTRLYWPCR